MTRIEAIAPSQSHLPIGCSVCPPKPFTNTTTHGPIDLGKLPIAACSGAVCAPTPQPLHQQDLVLRDCLSTVSHQYESRYEGMERQHKEHPLCC